MALGLTRRQIVMIVVLICGTFVAVLNQTVVTPMLPKVMADMDVGSTTAQWLTTGFTLVNAIMIPVTAFLTDRFPVRRMFVTAMGVFLAGTLLCAASVNFPMLLAGRMVQAAGAGIMQPLVMTVLLRTFPVERRGTAMGIFGVVIAFAPAIGPTVAGLVIDNVGWHVLFYAIAVLAVTVIAIALFVLEADAPINPDAHLDAPSVALSCIGFGGLLYGLSAIGDGGVSALAAGVLVVGIVALVVFFARQLRLDEPMLNVRVLANKRFLVATVIVMLVQASLMGGSVLMPIYMQTDLGMSATQSGLVMLPAALIMGVMGLVSGTLFDRYGPRVMAIVGLAIVTVTTFMFSFLGTEASMFYLMVLYATRMFGLSLVNGPVNTWGMNALENRMINHGTALNNTLRQVAGSLGTAIIVSVSAVAEGSRATTMSAVEASIFGIDAAFAVSAAICLVGFVLVCVFVKDAPQTVTELAQHGQQRSSDLPALVKRDVYTLTDDATVYDAMRVITQREIGGVTIVDAQGRLAGFVSDGDILRHLAKHDEVITDPMTMITQVLHEHEGDEDFRERVRGLMGMSVRVLLKRRPISVNEHAELKDVCATLGTGHLKKAPVVDDDGRLVGIIDRSDVMRFFMDRCLDGAGESETATATA